MSTTIDHTKESDSEGESINEELDEQTLILKYIRNATEVNNQILAELKINNKYLQLMCGDIVTEKDIDN